MAKANITDTDIAAMLDRMEELSLDAKDMADALSKNITSEIERPAARIASAIASTGRFADLARTLASVGRHMEDVTSLRASLRAEQAGG